MAVYVAKTEIPDGDKSGYIPAGGCSGIMLSNFPFDPPANYGTPEWQYGKYPEYEQTVEQLAAEIKKSISTYKTGHFAVLALKYQTRAAQALESLGFKKVFEFDSTHGQGQRVAMYAMGKGEQFFGPVVEKIVEKRVAAPTTTLKRVSKGMRKVKTLRSRLRGPKRATKLVR